MTFFGCESLKKVIIPASVMYIGFDNFGTTLSNTEIYFMGKKEQWEAVLIDEYGNERLNNANVCCAYKVISEISDVTLGNNKMSGKIT